MAALYSVCGTRPFANSSVSRKRPSMYNLAYTYDELDHGVKVTCNDDHSDGHQVGNTPYE